MISEWVKHTEIHWSRKVCGKRMDYWPTTSRFTWNKETMFGDPEVFISELMEDERKFQSKVIRERFEPKGLRQRQIILDCKHNNGSCEGIVIKTHNGFETLCHSCALELIRDDELQLIVDWLKCQTRFGLPKFVITYLEEKRYR